MNPININSLLLINKKNIKFVKFFCYEPNYITNDHSLILGQIKFQTPS